MRVAIIPARGGSKRIPRKNVKEFGGKAIIAWSIEAAIESECFERIIVSTDDTEIACIAERHGAEVPFLRPSDLADDHTGTIPVIAHAIDWLCKRGTLVNEACCIYSTAPFLRSIDLRKSLDILLSTQADYVVSVTEYGFPIQRALRLEQNNHLIMIDQSRFETRSQDLEETFHDAGQFYWGRAEAWSNMKPLFLQRTVPLLIPRHRVQDIDTLEDWKRAELMHKSLSLYTNRTKKAHD